MKTLEPTIHYNPDLTQIINGEEVMSPSPKMPHQSASGELVFLLTSYVKTHRLGRIFTAPFDVILEQDFNRLQPDIFFVSNANRDIMQDWIRGVPDLVIEIVSPSSKKLDTVVKKSVYETYGVPECWIVFPEKICIEVYTLVDERYTLLGSYAGEEHVRSQVLKGLSFPVNVINE
ncbi:Uma2 family endonuclease [Dyadobacter fermentans]|uniref:Uma2 family endonuclease n=1 Tax=Dyadobacter fermentans TaxID=94254 RepID=UPI001CBF4879|nr:Uma2 family endonuclease [Dyadobacter fermentans]MBZ1362848.1 Uma2 family endonuclease [Dyadobacter fermentans]